MSFLYLPHENLKFKKDEIHSPKVTLENLNKNFDGCLLIEPAWVFLCTQNSVILLLMRVKYLTLNILKKRKKKMYYNIKFR